jgi:SagB-type dehydrogenase family enzyme
LRTAPSAGARHPFETYLVVNRVEGLAPGLYRYLGLEHQLLCLQKGDYAERVGTACNGQAFVGRGAVVFIWTALPYRTEWRYSVVAHRVIAMDAGHTCENLYLAAEAVGAGTCAIGAYDQALMDELVGVDGDDELVIYAAPVGHLPRPWLSARPTLRRQSTRLGGAVSFRLPEQ